jgi:hypothetical protein
MSHELQEKQVRLCFEYRKGILIQVVENTNYTWTALFNSHLQSKSFVKNKP